MRVLLTGHQGYLGTVMAPVLAAAGHEVVGLDAGLFADCVLGPPPADPPGHRVDLRADIVLNNLVGHALLSGEVLVLSDGTPWRPLVHAADIARAFTAALTAPREAVHDRAFNIGSETNNVTVAEIAEQVAEAVSGAKVRITGESGADPRSYRVDFSRFRAAIPGFDIEWSVKRGALELADTYRKFALTKEDFDQRFTRLAVLRAASEAGTVDDTLRWRR